ncbi:unnamed protein product [Sphagnum balticum]
MAYGNHADESRRLVDYISRVVDALSSQDGVALAELLVVSGGSWGHSVASALDITKVGLICLLNKPHSTMKVFGALAVGTVHLCRSVSQSKETVPVFKFEEFPTNDQVECIMAILIHRNIIKGYFSQKVKY